MLQPLREETEGQLQMLLSPRKNGLTSLFKERLGFSRNLVGPRTAPTAVSSQEDFGMQS